MQLTHRFPTEPRAGLRNTRLARHFDGRRRVEKPLHTLEQAAQHLAIRRMHIERQRDHIINHHMSRQIELADTGRPRCRQHRMNLAHREGLGDHPKTDVIRDPAPDRKGCNGSCHLLRPHMWKRARWRIMINKSLNEQYWSLTVYR